MTQEEKEFWKQAALTVLEGAIRDTSYIVSHKDGAIKYVADVADQLVDEFRKRAR